MHRSNIPILGIRQSLGEQALCLLCDVCGRPLNRRTIECVLKLLKPASFTYHLHLRLGNPIVLWVLGLFKKFYRAELNSKMRF